VDEILDITLDVAAAFERLGIPYLIGGSLASSLHGIPRATQDVDFVALMKLPHVPQFAESLRGRFYLDEDAIRDAVERRSSFNVIHLDSYFKADIFVRADDEATRLQIQRRQRFALPGTPAREVIVASPEDVIAQKLSWFALGDQVSERQWSDAIGVLKVAGRGLDLSYLRRVASLLGVSSLLDRALSEAGLNA
jgi:hypothetical protein